LEQPQVALLRVVQWRRQTLWVEGGVQEGQLSWVAWLGHDAQELQVEGQGSLLPCWKIGLLTIPPSLFFLQSRNL